MDTWDNDQPAVQTLNDTDYSYRVFPRLLGPEGSFKWGSFINTNHWMIDLVDVSDFRLSGGILISPDQTFHFENGRLVVEADAAPGAPGMGSADHFYELDISGADAPTPWVTDALYGYGQFGGTGAIGCRIEGGLICAMYDNSNRVTGGECPNDGRACTDNGGRPGRVWETQGAGTANTAASVQGGYPQWPIPGTNLHVSDVFRHCADNGHDLHCRDRWRMEFEKDSIHVFANGYPVMLIDGLFARNPATGADNRIPDAWLNNGARFYMTSWINGGQHSPLRWHWNNVAVNPPYPASAAVSESFCAGQFAADGSPNTCPHAHVAGCPELQAAGTTCLSGPQPSPTITPTLTPTLQPGTTPTAQPTPTATVVPPPPATSTTTPTRGKKECLPPRSKKLCG